MNQQSPIATKETRTWMALNRLRSSRRVVVIDNSLHWPLITHTNSLASHPGRKEEGPSSLMNLPRCCCYCFSLFLSPVSPFILISLLGPVSCWFFLRTSLANIRSGLKTHNSRLRFLFRYSHTTHAIHGIHKWGLLLPPLSICSSHLTWCI